VCKIREITKKIKQEEIQERQQESTRGKESGSKCGPLAKLMQNCSKLLCSKLSKPNTSRMPRRVTVMVFESNGCGVRE
jgi:hypothetical protein